MREALIEPCRLSPEPVRVPGHKHTAVPIMASAVVIPGPIRLSNVSRITDTCLLAEILQRGGARVEWSGSDLEIDARPFSAREIPGDLGGRIHGALYLLPVILGRFGSVRIGQSGGCQIGPSAGNGARPVTHLLSTLERFGGRFTAAGADISGTADRFTPTRIDVMDYSDRSDVLNGPYVSGVTKTALLAAICSTEGGTSVVNPYSKPDVTELARFLDGRVARVERLPGEIRVSVGPDIDSEQPFSLLSDLSEVMTWITLSVLHCVEVELELVEIDRVLVGLTAEVRLLEAMGIRFERRGARLHVVPPRSLRSVDIEVTSVGIYSDHQPFFALLLLRGDRAATLRDCVWTERFAYAEELRKLGANIESRPGEIRIYPSHLRAAPGVAIEARDLRAAAALLVAATSLESPVRLRGVEHLERGHEDLTRSLQRWGARIHA